MDEGCLCKKPFELYPFPTERKDHYARKVWIKVVDHSKGEKSDKIWIPKKFDRVCSDHFIDGKPTEHNPYPTEILGSSATIVKARKPPATRSEPPLKKSKLSNDPSTSTNTQQEDLYEEHNYSFQCDCPHSCTEGKRIGKCMQKQKHFQELSKLYEDLKESSEQNKNSKPAVSGKKVNETLKFIQSDRKVKLYTGLRSKDAFNDLLRMISKKASKMRYWSGEKKSKATVRVYKTTPLKSGPRRKLTLREELLMTLMKLPLATINEMLADIFGVSNSVVSQVINTWVKLLASELRPLIFWPSKDAIWSSFPKSLGSQYRALRCTIDCTEIFIEKPRHLRIQALTWSDYKHHNTIKFLVGIVPNGMVSFLSKAWGGRTSDKFLTRSSGFYDLLERDDLILADRGFPIKEDLLQQFCELEIPPPGSGKEQMTGDKVHDTKDVANARIHVERAIGQMKHFAILTHTLPITLVPLFDDIAVVCAALCNLLPPLVE